MTDQNSPADLIRLHVCLYLRMSDDEQTTSIGIQRKRCREHAAARGWVVVEEFLDEGKSGSKDFAKRVDFHRMVDAAVAGNWTAVLCLDTSRFGRLDILDGAATKVRLRAAGVHLETLYEGRIDWSTQQGRIQDAFLSEQAHDFSRRLASKVVDGKVRSLEHGWWPHGNIPFGYAVQYFDGSTPKHTCGRTERSTRPKRWTCKLIVVEVDAAVVRTIFGWYVVEDLSLRTIAGRLNTQGTVAPEGGPWSLGSVGKVLDNPVYGGWATIGEQPNTHPGAFSRVTAQRYRSQPAIVEDLTFDDAARKRTARKATGRRVRNGSAGPLTGVLICGHCGHRMARKRFTSGTVYVCVSPSLRPHLGCRQRRVHEDAIVPAVCAEVVAAVDWATLEQARAKPPAEASVDLDALAKRVEDLDRSLRRSQSAFLDAEVRDRPGMQSIIDERRAALDAARNAFTIAESPPADADRFTAWADQVKGTLITLMPAIRFSYLDMVGGPFGMSMPGIVEVERPGIDTDTDTLRALLLRLNLSVTLWWRPKGPRNFSLERGLLRAEFGGLPITNENLCGRTGSTPAAKVLIERVMVFAAPPPTMTPAERQRAYRARKVA